MEPLLFSLAMPSITTLTLFNFPPSLRLPLFTVPHTQTALIPPESSTASIQTIGFVGTRTELLTAAEARVMMDAVEDKADEVWARA